MRVCKIAERNARTAAINGYRWSFTEFYVGVLAHRLVHCLHLALALMSWMMGQNMILRVYYIK